MENILSVIIINQCDEEENVKRRGIMNYSSFSFRPCNIILQRDNSGFVYMLISLKSVEFIYIGKTKDLHQQMMSHQSGLGCIAMHLEDLRPYVYFVYIYIFTDYESAMFYVERQSRK